MSEHSPTRVAFVGGRVWTVGYATTRELDVLIEGGQIVDVASAGNLQLDGADVIELGGRTLTPGFQDAHIHMALGGLNLAGCDMSDARSAEEVISRLTEHVAQNPDLPWITGSGWYRELFPYPEGPTKEMLDAIVSDRPAFITPFDMHGVWVNSKALEMAGIDASSPDPETGYFRRDADGNLTGMLEEGASELIRAIMPKTTHEDLVAALLRAQDHAMALGITSVQDAAVGTAFGMPDSLEAYADAISAGSFKMRLTAALWWDPQRGVEQIPELVARRTRLESVAGPDRVRADTVKVMVDGLDHVFLNADHIRELTVALDAEGFALHYHSYGDGATHWILDGIEEAIRVNGPRVRRHHIAHLFVVAGEDLARFAELGVTANVQGAWSGSSVPHDHMIDSTIIEDPGNHEYPFGRLQALGARLAGGSDWPVTTADPLQAIAAAADELREPGIREAIDPRDRLDALSMFTAYTTGTAHVNGRASTVGRIAPGYAADFAIIDRDIFEPNVLAGALVDEVWIAGERTYSRLT